MVNVEMQDTMEAYVTLAERIEKEQSVYFTGPMGDDIFQFSPFPLGIFLPIFLIRIPAIGIKRRHYLIGEIL